jgi:hypothetical protein
MEYVLVHRGGRGQSFVNELVYDGNGNDGQPFVPGLIDVEQLRALHKHNYDAQRSGQSGERSGSGRPGVGARLGGGREDEAAKSHEKKASEPASREDDNENALPGPTAKPRASYPPPPSYTRTPGE